MSAKLLVTILLILNAQDTIKAAKQPAIEDQHLQQVRYCLLSEDPKDVNGDIVETRYEETSFKEFWKGYKPIHVVCQNQPEDTKKLIQQLHDREAHLYSEWSGATPYELAIQYGNLPALEKLAELRSDFRSSGKRNSFLHQACFYDSPDIIRFMLKQYPSEHSVPYAATRNVSGKQYYMYEDSIIPRVYEVRRIIGAELLLDQNIVRLAENLTPFTLICIRYCEEFIVNKRASANQNNVFISKSKINHTDLTLLDEFLKLSPTISYVREVLEILNFTLIPQAEERLAQAEAWCCIS